MKRFLTVFLILISGALAAKQSMREAMMEIYNNKGADITVTSPDAFMGQKAGYVTGGNAVIRNKIENVRPLTVNLPHLNDMAGCGGIDIYTGGLSFINDQQLIEVFKSIVSNSEAYAFRLALQTVSPQIDNVMSELYTLAAAVNSFNINSCEQAMQMIDSLALNRDIAQQQQCRRDSIYDGDFEGYHSSRSYCAEEDDEEKKFYNLTWDVINNNPNINCSSQQMKEILMNLVGSVIVNKQGVDHIQPKIRDNEFLHALMYGGRMRLEQCSDGAQCLYTREVVIDIPRAESWIGTLEAMFDRLQEKCLKDEAMTQEERNFVCLHRLPLLNIIGSVVCYYKDVCHQESTNLATLLVKESLADYLQEVINNVSASCIEMKHSSFFDEDINDFLDRLDGLETRVERFRKKSRDEIEIERAMLERADYMERKVWEDIKF